MARMVVLPSLSDVLFVDDAACAFNEEAQRHLLMRSPEPLPTREERLSYAALFPPPIAEALGKRRRGGDVLLTMDELNDIAPVLDDDDGEHNDDDEAPQPVVVATEVPPRRVEPTQRAFKPDVQRAVEEADVRWLEAHALNVRQQPYEVYAKSKFRTPVVSGGTVELSTLRLAVYRAFVANAREDRVEEALAVITTLVERCGLNPSVDAGSETLLEFVSSKADAYAVEHCAASDDLIHVRVLRTLLRAHGGYLAERAPLCEALARLVEDKREACVVELLEERGEHLTDADVFDVVTRIMLYGTRAMLRRALQALDDDDRVPPTLRHPRTKSTLLHFATKYAAALVEVVRPYSDATLTDRHGHTAAHYARAAHGV